MKKVSFNLNKNIICITYSPNEYSRRQIDSILYLKSYKKINEHEWKAMLRELNNYKFSEMLIHKDSIRNTKIA